MLGSTFSIGVPFKAQLIAPLLGEFAVANNVTASMVVVVIGLVGGLASLWRRAAPGDKKD
jgi:hypothetical protein